ncbi:hypothetical protein VPNG_06111 [Cytospora leucostoma]|uniref:Nucleoside 2-deoxyribosyltransferase domain-containing protein n=1 Tax=Cytospora leucostoma TaxID=1230097 RepID=A0A423WWZ5_9PEZI|nr:hypothetical protein VPNG_06111 [Cytospora leucostoma]
MSRTPKVQVITPNDTDQNPSYPTTSVFLAGPTECPWRTNFLATLRSLIEKSPHPNITVYNPYQPNWGPSWREDLADNRFTTQVEWELERQESATIVALFFHGDSKAPLSLLELGLSARSGKAVVGCDKAYWKRGYVQAVCQRYGVPMADDLDGLATLVADKLKGSRA